MTGSSSLWARPAHAPTHLREGRGAGPQRHEAASQPPPAPGPRFPARSPGSPEPAPGLPSWPPRLSRRPHCPCAGRPWWLPAAQACLLVCPVPCCVLRVSEAQALPLTWGNPQDLLQTPSPTGTRGGVSVGSSDTAQWHLRPSRHRASDRLPPCSSTASSLHFVRASDTRTSSPNTSQHASESRGRPPHLTVPGVTSCPLSGSLPRQPVLGAQTPPASPVGPVPPGLAASRRLQNGFSDRRGEAVRSELALLFSCCGQEGADTLHTCTSPRQQPGVY